MMVGSLSVKTLEELKAKHDREVSMIETQMKSLAKPQLGRKPLSAEEIAAKKEKLMSELKSKQEKESLDFAEYLANLPPQSDEKDSSMHITPSGSADTPDSCISGPNTPPSDPLELKKSKTEIRREKQYQARLAAAAAAPTINFREKEMNALNDELGMHDFLVKEIPADGNCMFRAISDQLPPSDAYVYTNLRKLAADYIERKWEEFSPFLPYEDIDNYPDNVNDSFKVRAAVSSYCSRLVEKGIWGGHPELKALANVLGYPIAIFQVEHFPQLIFPEGVVDKFTSKERLSTISSILKDDGLIVRLSYHKHYLSQGEHYNSVVRK